MLIAPRHRARSSCWNLLVLVALVVPIPSWAVCLQDLKFTPATSYITGWNTTNIVTADFDEDGFTDLAVCNDYALANGGFGSDVSVLLGRGDGAFDPAVDYVAGTKAHGLVAGDYNEDGITDLAVCNTGSHNVSILLGLGSAGVGNGTFGAPTHYPCGAGPFRILSADFNEDGITDLVVSNNAVAAVTVLLGMGSGGVGSGAFGGPVSYALSNLSTGLALGDFNSDGITDVAATENYSGTVAILLGNGSGGVGNGTFAPAAHVPAGVEPYGIYVHDFDGDGISDLAVANTGGGGVALLRGNGSAGIGNGTFAPPSTILSGNSTSANTVDANQDGIADLLVTLATNPGVLRLYLGQGTGLVNASEFGDPSDYPVGGDPIETTLADFNGDGKLDVAVPNYFETFISVLLGTCASDPRAPTLTRVRDVPNDQGGKVFVTWTRSSLDVTGGSVTDYRVWRRIPPEVAATTAAHERRSRWMARPSSASEALIEYWEAVATLPAQRLAGYGYTATTTQDSMHFSNPYTAFFITALTYNINVFYESNVDSGYSVDNKPPNGPNQLVAQPGPSGTVALHWDASTDEDLAGYRLYRGASSEFVPSEENLISAQADTGYVAADGMGYTYKLTAVDAHGNESPHVSVTVTGTTGVGPAGAAFALHGIRPNPALGHEAMLWFTLPDLEPARLTVLDLSGRVVASRWVSGSGQQSVALTTGRPLAAGVYLVKLTRGRDTLRTKAVIMR